MSVKYKVPTIPRAIRPPTQKRNFHASGSVHYKIPTIPRAKPPPTQKTHNPLVSGSVNFANPPSEAKPQEVKAPSKSHIDHRFVSTREVGKPRDFTGPIKKTPPPLPERNKKNNKLTNRELHEKLRINLRNNELNKLTNTQLYGKLNSNLGRLIQPTRSPPKSRNVLNSNQNAQNQLLKRWKKPIPINSRKKPIPINSRKSKKLREEGKFNSLMNRVRHNSPRATKKLNA
jgi:hypothetical protein